MPKFVKNQLNVHLKIGILYINDTFKKLILKRYPKILQLLKILNYADDEFENNEPTVSNKALEWQKLTSVMIV